MTRQVFVDFLAKMRKRPNYISPVAYDTGWVAWLYPQSLDWIIENQWPDGSWGSAVEYYHDRVISTLSAINAIAASSTNKHHLNQIEAGIKYLEKAIPHLQEDVFETVGFELLLPNLVNIAESLGLNVCQIKALIEPQMPLYYKKLALIPKELVYSKDVVVAHSLEFISFEDLDRSAIPALRSINGSIHNSPSATAFVEIASGGSIEGRGYLERLLEINNGTVPGFAPFELFEIIWALHHLSLNIDLASLRPEIDPWIHLMAGVWRDDGVGFSTTFISDPDDTSLALRVFGKLGIYWDPGVLEAYEREDHFQCFPLERNISLDVHIHIIHALKNAGHFPRSDDMLLKALNILGRHLTTDFIVDKWHISPYYSTSHAITALTGLSDNIITRQVKWIMKNQRENGSWSYYPNHPASAIEETAYALMALMTLYERQGDIPFDMITKGIRFIEANYTCAEDLPALWINKALYNPYHIVDSIILSVLAKYQNLLNKKANRS